ncbi:MAG: MFS transporter [Candidatus Aminicenantes bacterium]|nr:MFS transporter [Candidatus Aminicenantes bacterium]
MNDPLNQKHVRSYKLMSSACAGMFVFGIVMAILGAILPTLFSEIQFNKSEAGNLFFTMNLSMLVMSLLFGPVVDRFGFKIFLAVCSLLVAFSFFLFTTATTYTNVLVAAIILGFGGGGLNGGTNALTSDIHPDRRATALNLLGIFFGFGALTIPFLIGAFLGRVGLDPILMFATFLSLIPFILFVSFPFPKPKHEQGFPLLEAKKVVKHPLLWLCGILLFFQSGNEFMVGGWISTYLNEHFGLTPTTASFLLAGYWAAIMSGRLVSTKVVKFMKNEKLILGSAFLSLFAAILIVAAPSKELSSLGVVLIGLGFAAVFPTTLAIAGEAFPSFTGTAFGIIFVIALTGGMLSPWLAGKIAHVYNIQRAMFIPIFNCSMIICVLVLIQKTLKSHKYSQF